MNTSTPQLIFSTEGFASRPELVVHSEEKTAKLLRHLHPRVTGVWMHVKHDSPHSRPRLFTVCAVADTVGTEHLAHATAVEPHAAINAAFDKLERSLTAAALTRKHRERNLRPVESGAGVVAM
jgi:ribosome-associated translation inhibitor RaiA